MMEELMRYAHGVACKVARREDDEYLSAANEALVMALKTYDPTRGTTIKQYVAVCVKKAVLQTLKVERRRRAIGGGLHDGVLATIPSRDFFDFESLVFGLKDPLAEEYFLKGKRIREIAGDRGESPMSTCRALKGVRRRLYERS